MCHDRHSRECVFDERAERLLAGVGVEGFPRRTRLPILVTRLDRFLTIRARFTTGFAICWFGRRLRNLLATSKPQPSD
jgi:hypothetical protein